MDIPEEECKDSMDSNDGEMSPEIPKKGVPYRAKFTFNPNVPGPSWKDSFPANNVSCKMFEYKCSTLQQKSREELAIRRSNARKAVFREESQEEMTTNEMFLKLMKKLDDRSDGIEAKINLQDEKVVNLEKLVNK